MKYLRFILILFICENILSGCGVETVDYELKRDDEEYLCSEINIEETDNIKDDMNEFFEENIDETTYSFDIDISNTPISNRDITEITNLLNCNFPLCNSKECKIIKNKDINMTEEDIYRNFIANGYGYNMDTFRWGDGTSNYSLAEIDFDYVDVNSDKYITQIAISNISGLPSFIIICDTNNVPLVTVNLDSNNMYNVNSNTDKF